MTQDLTDLKERYDAFMEFLLTITNGLMEMADSAGRTGYTKNQLLTECYNLVNEEMHTLEEWHELGRYVKEQEHGYLFWDTNGGLMMMFTRDQLMSKEYALEFIAEQPNGRNYIQLSLFD